MLGSSTVFPICRVTGEECRLRTREAVYGDKASGVTQCLDCSLVMEAAAWKPRTCSFCDFEWGESLHDPCLGTIPANSGSGACCGHGEPGRQYGVPDGYIGPHGPVGPRGLERS